MSKPIVISVRNAATDLIDEAYGYVEFRRLASRSANSWELDRALEYAETQHVTVVGIKKNTALTQGRFEFDA